MDIFEQMKAGLGRCCQRPGVLAGLGGVAQHFNGAGRDTRGPVLAAVAFANGAHCAGLGIGEGAVSREPSALRPVIVKVILSPGLPLNTWAQSTKAGAVRGRVCTPAMRDLTASKPASITQLGAEGKADDQRAAVGSLQVAISPRVRMDQCVGVLAQAEVEMGKFATPRQVNFAQRRAGGDALAPFAP